ncbi:PHP domain-containing protein [Desulfofalx alkaliphila]|uniref:PHP domain-containing protein n=1 Tax=Desulfofalx alkaliphila TaxID=105483 RepID=UPI0004E26A67|nr:hypothetical protein [Desulfofalx alkaliphila]
MNKYHRYSGVIHVHSRYSDGLSDVPTIIKAARQANCDYLIVSDHDTLRPFSCQGWYDKTILLVGEEITVKDNGGHYLALGINTVVPPGGDAQQTIDEVADQGGIGIIAHPFSEKREDRFKLTPVEWQNWDVVGFNGMEIWNYSHDWIDNFRFPISLIRPEVYIEGPPAEVFKKWDKLLQKRRVVGIGSVDAHGYFYSYRRMFKALRTHLFLEAPLSFKSAYFERDKYLIYRAIKRGNCYFSYDHLAPSDGFIYWAHNGIRPVIMGDVIKGDRGVTLRVSIPERALVRIINRGRVVASADNTQTLKKKVYKTGAYRVEVLLNTYKGVRKAYRPWIYSNPIYVKASA